MKTVIYIAALVLMLTVITSGSNLVENKSTASFKNNAVASLVQGLNSNNIGLIKSCAYFAGKYKINQAVESLVNILSSKKYAVDVRILAALSLYEIGDKDGMTVLRDIAKSDSNLRLKKRCILLYNEYNKKLFAENK